MRLLSYSKGGAPILVNIEARPLPPLGPGAPELVLLEFKMVTAPPDSPASQGAAADAAASGGSPAAGRSSDGGGASPRPPASAPAAAPAPLADGAPSRLELAEGSELDLDGDARFNVSACVATEAERPWRIVAVNRKWTAMTGFTPADAVGRTSSILQGPATCQKALDTLHRACAAGEPMRMRLINYDARGHPFVNTLQVFPVRCAGSVRRWISFSIRDELPVPAAAHPRVAGAPRPGAPTLAERDQEN